MFQVRVWLRKGLVLVGGLLLIPLLVLVLVLAAVLSRPLFVIAAIAVVVCAVLYVMSPAFRRWLDAMIDDEVQCKGFRLSNKVALHPSHSWARVLPRGVLVGADDLVQAALGPVRAVDLPTVGQRIEGGERLFTLRRGNRSVDVLSPIAGTVLARNESLFSHPGFVNDEPFGRGWAVRLRPENVAEGERQLFHGQEAREWFGREIDRMLTCLHGDESAPASLADGGAVVNDLYQQIDDQAWQRLMESFFARKAKTLS